MEGRKEFQVGCEAHIDITGYEMADVVATGDSERDMRVGNTPPTSPLGQRIREKTWGRIQGVGQGYSALVEQKRH